MVSVTYENERISIKKQLTLLKMCVTSLLCGPRADLWPFYEFLCIVNGFLSYLFIERHILSKVSCFLLKFFHFRRLHKP